MNRNNKIIFGIIIGTALSLATLALPQTIQTQSHLEKIQFGFPFWFIEQNQSAVDRDFPIVLTISSPWENPTDIHWVGFLGSSLTYGIILFIIKYIAITNMKQRKQTPSS